MKMYYSCRSIEVVPGWGSFFYPYMGKVSVTEMYYFGRSIKVVPGWESFFTRIQGKYRQFT
jgi:hypothetical protein